MEKCVLKVLVTVPDVVNNAVVRELMASKLVQVATVLGDDCDKPEAWLSNGACNDGLGKAIYSISKAVGGAEQVVPKGIYEHFKGNTYEVLHVAQHTETDELTVIYKRSDIPSPIYARPLEMFCEQVTFKNKLVPRFSLLRNFEVAYEKL